ncbi:hypothetical protein AJ87_19690 [Rhizobium yanglingense]|nr:hypothetical protein AJ87_19690 [Rhizobium yanglingense]
MGRTNRHQQGALPIEIVGVVSNHFDYQKVVVNHDIPFHHIPVTKANKPQAEARIMDVVEQTGTELICLMTSSSIRMELSDSQRAVSRTMMFPWFRGPSMPGFPSDHRNLSAGLFSTDAPGAMQVNFGNLLSQHWMTAGT